MKKAVSEGIKRNRDFMLSSEDYAELHEAYIGAKAYIAGCNDSDSLTHEEWKAEHEYLKTLYSNLNPVQGA